MAVCSTPTPGMPRGSTTRACPCNEVADVFEWGSHHLLFGKGKGKGKGKGFTDCCHRIDPFG